MLVINSQGLIERETINKLSLDVVSNNDIVFLGKDAIKGLLNECENLKFWSETTDYKDFIFNPERQYRLYGEDDNGFYHIRKYNDESDFEEIKTVEHKTYIYNKYNKHIPADLYFDEVVLTFHIDSEVLYEDESVIISLYEYDYEDDDDVELHIYKKDNKGDTSMSYKEKMIEKIIEEWLEEAPKNEIDKVKNVLLDEFDNINRSEEGLNVKVFKKDEVDSFAEIATANEKSMEHSWAGSNYNQVTFLSIFGRVEYGKNSYSEYSQNGSTGSPDIVKEIVDFDENDSIIFLRRDYSYDSLSQNRSGTVYSSTSYTLVYYNMTSFD
jgi:hypothetical protein